MYSYRSFKNVVGEGQPLELLYQFSPYFIHIRRSLYYVSRKSPTFNSFLEIPVLCLSWVQLMVHYIWRSLYCCYSPEFSPYFSHFMRFLYYVSPGFSPYFIHIWRTLHCCCPPEFSPLLIKKGDSCVIFLLSSAHVSLYLEISVMLLLYFSYIMRFLCYVSSEFRTYYIHI